MSDALDYRDFGGVPTSGDDPAAWDFGWHRDPAEVARIARGLSCPSASSTPAGRVPLAELPDRVFLWDAHRKIEGRNPPAKDQKRVGSCVAFGTCNAIRRTMAVEIALGGEPERLVDIVEEAVYGGSRVEVGGGRIAGDGSVGAWAARFVCDWGVLARGVYGRFDLTDYREDTCREFGYSGVPAELEALSKEHPVRDITAVGTWAEAKRMLASGYGIAVCSAQGFSMRRDARGVAAPSGTWNHCMCLDGYAVLPGGEEFGHLVNSWGPDTHTGPVGWGEPGTEGFWADAGAVAGMLAAGDSWAFSHLQGFPAQKIDWRTVT